MLNRLHLLAIATALAGISALAALALKFSFELVFVCICVSTLAGFWLVGTLQRQRAMCEHAGTAIGQFSRGRWQARVQPDAHDDAFSRLQHRINNLLDSIDLHLRGDEAAIDQEHYAEYAEKLRYTALYESLSQHKSLAEIKAERTPNESVGVLLQQLGHNVAELFKGDDAEPAAVRRAPERWREQLGNAHAEQLERLQHALARVQAASNKLAERAMHPLPTPVDAPRRSATALNQLMAQIAEQATVVALNVAIESGRVADGGALQGAAEELQEMAVMLHQARADMGGLLAHAIPMPEPMPSVPLSYAIDALATAESALQQETGAVEALQLQWQPEPVDEAA